MCLLNNPVLDEVKIIQDKGRHFFNVLRSTNLLLSGRLLFVLRKSLKDSSLCMVTHSFNHIEYFFGNDILFGLILSLEVHNSLQGLRVFKPGEKTLQCSLLLIIVTKKTIFDISPTLPSSLDFPPDIVFS